jgi:hypothetical protein
MFPLCKPSSGWTHNCGMNCTLQCRERFQQDLALRCPYTYESGSRVRLGELDSGARLGYISPLKMPIHIRVWLASPAVLGFQWVKLVCVWSDTSRTWPILAWLVRAFGGARLAAGLLLACTCVGGLRANSMPAASRAPPKTLTSQARIGQVRLVTIHT